MARERGSVTAELAVGLPVVILLLAAVLAFGAASTAHLRAMDAARAGARAIAIGESVATASLAVSRVGGDDAAVSFSTSGDWVTARVTKPLAGGPLRLLPVQVSAEATAWKEP